MTVRLPIVLRALMALTLVALLAACGQSAKWHNTELTGAMPDLSFTMTRVDDGKTVTAADYKGDVVMVYFGYTYCPDICPETLANIAEILSKLGADAKHVRMLFVTVDPNRDTPEVLKQYVDSFAPEVDGLRGSADQLARLAKAYRASYSVTPSPDPSKYEVTHSAAVYVFDTQGRARLLLSSLHDPNPDLDATVADLERLIHEGQSQGPIGWVKQLL